MGRLVLRLRSKRGARNHEGVLKPACRVMLLGALLALAVRPLPAAPSQPNVILILADDLGWTDLHCYGSDLYQTPHIDQLAREGMKFTQHYSACTVCSPTRAALMTGKYPARLHITDWIPGLPPENPKLLVPDWTKHLPLEETTIANVFKSAHYATASIGKWHLGGEAYYPEKHGFDLNIAGTEAPSPTSYFAPWNIPTLTEGNKGDYLTDRLGEEAVKFIEREKDRRFFLYYPHYQHYQLGGTTPYGAVRLGDFKLIEFLDDLRVELYNLREDIGEQHNLAARMPEKVAQLRERLHAWRREVGAQMPARNPDYDPTRPEHTPAAAQKRKPAE